MAFSLGIFSTQHPIIPPFNADASYTITLQQLCEVLTNKYGKNFNEVAKDAVPKLFNFDYEFWTDNEELKKEFETNFLRHFFMREIGFETPAYFRLKLEDAFKLWMPYYSNLARAALKANNLDWTLTDDYYIDFTHVGNKARAINDQNKTVNEGTTNRNLDQTGTGKNTNKGTTNSTSDTTANTMNGGSDVSTETGSTSHDYDKAITRTDTPQDRFQQGGRGDEFATDVLDVKMDFASEVTRENYRGTDTAVDKKNTTEYGHTVNQTGNDTTNGSFNNDSTSDTTLKTVDSGNTNSTSNYTGNRTDNANDDVHEVTHESGRRGVAWIDIYDKYMKAIRNIEDEIYRKMDPLLFMQIWG